MTIIADLASIDTSPNGQVGDKKGIFYTLEAVIV